MADMNAAAVLQRIGETFGSTASVKAVFGEPIHSQGKTVVPVAKVAYALGGGFGSGKAPGPADRHGEGGGGGGAVRAFPAGALEITDAGTRFVPFVDVKLLGVALAAGVMIGGLLAMRRR
jgi:uncharacterized spore protein YtfJ